MYKVRSMKTGQMKILHQARLLLWLGDFKDVNHVVHTLPHIGVILHMTKHILCHIIYVIHVTIAGRKGCPKYLHPSTVLMVVPYPLQNQLSDILFHEIIWKVPYGRKGTGGNRLVAPRAGTTAAVSSPSSLLSISMMSSSSTSSTWIRTPDELANAAGGLFPECPSSLILLGSWWELECSPPLRWLQTTDLLLLLDRLWRKLKLDCSSPCEGGLELVWDVCTDASWTWAMDFGVDCLHP